VRERGGVGWGGERERWEESYRSDYQGFRKEQISAKTRSKDGVCGTCIAHSARVGECLCVCARALLCVFVCSCAHRHSRTLTLTLAFSRTLSLSLSLP
jgi:hypothetical protein